MAGVNSTPRTIDPFSREVLEFAEVIDLLHGFLSGPISEALLAQLEPRTNLEEIRRDLELARETREYLRESPRPSLAALGEPRPLFAKLRVEGLSLAALEILALVELARAGLEMFRLLAKHPTPRLADLARGMPDFRSLLTELGGKINPDGSLDSSASPELARIRRSLERLKLEIQTSLERMLRRFGQEGVLQDAVVTIRNDRFVIPVRVEDKRRVQGVVHGMSSSGATVYIEPLDTLALNNELVELQDREFAEIQRILGEFTRKLQERREDLGRATEILSEIDLAFAKGEFSRQYDCCIPEFPQERALGLHAARHPLLDKSLRSLNRRPVPLSLELKAPKTLVVISGPNTGGKTVALKTLGIMVLMAQAGIPVPADEAKLPLFGHVLADIGDQQSIAANLSTFSGHVTNIEAMAQIAESNDLVLLDEIGASTEPNEGAALAVAILEHFRQRGAMTLVSTHHSRLKAYAAETPEAVNAAMEFDEATLQPTYRLLVGLPGKSSALDIAARLGLDPSIVAKARSLLHPADAEAAALVAGLHQQRSEMERRLETLEGQKRELAARREELERQFQHDRRAKLRELDTRLEGTLRQYAKNWEESLQELRTQSAPAKVVARGERKAAGLVREAREEWNTQVLEALDLPAAPEDAPLERLPEVGDRVRVANVSTPGIVTAIPDHDHVEVAVGRLKMRVGKDEIRMILPGGASAPEAVAPVPSSGEVPEEFNVIGNTAEEACERVDKFLDQAFLGNRSRVRIIHGHGKGILRKTLHEMFSHHPHVGKFYLAAPQEGGSGATIIELKP